MSGQEHISQRTASGNAALTFKDAAPPSPAAGDLPGSTPFVSTLTEALGISALNFLFPLGALAGWAVSIPPGQEAECCGRRAAAPRRSPPVCRSDRTPPARACCSGDRRMGAFSTGPGMPGDRWGKGGGGGSVPVPISLDRWADPVLLRTQTPLMANLLSTGNHVVNLLVLVLSGLQALKGEAGSRTPTRRSL